MQQARRVDRAGREQHLALASQERRARAVLDDLDPYGAAVFDDDPGHADAGLDRQVLAAPRRREIGARGRRALGVAHRHLVVADALLPRAVEVRIVGDAVFLRRRAGRPRRSAAG